MTKLTLDQFHRITLHRFGQLEPRPTDVPHITWTTYPWVMKWWQNFDAWQHWKDVGGPRPAVWRIVPPFAWILRRKILASRPKVPPAQPTPATPPLPPLPPSAARFQNGLYLGQNPGDALYSRPRYVAIFTADPAYDEYATKGMADTFRNQGHEVMVWYVPSEVSSARAHEVAARIGANTIIGQAETLEQFWASWHDNCVAVIGNLSGILDDPNAMDIVRTGKMIFVNEFYWNQDKNRKPDNHQLPVPSLCIAVYDGHSDSTSGAAWQPSVQDYKDAGYLWSSVSAYGPGMTPQQYAQLP